MVGWRKPVLMAAGCGGGFAVVMASLVGGVFWYQRPQKQPDWNSTAIKAIFKDFSLIASVPKPRFTFSYILENTTSSDYSIDDKSQIMIMATLPEGGNVFEADEALSLPTPFYLPAKQKVVLTISKESEYSEAYPERDNDRADKAATFIARHLKELGGFVLFDKTRRYKILFPGKWPELGP